MTAKSRSVSHPHVAFNALLLSGDPSYRSAGVHQYTYHLLAHLARETCEVTAFVSPNMRLQNEIINVVRSRMPTHRPVIRILWEQLFMPLLLQRIGADIVHGPVNVLPLGTNVPGVVTVLDLSFLRFPHFFRPANRSYLALFTRWSVHRAERIITISEHTASEVVQLLGVKRSKIRVIYPGVRADFRPLPASEVEAFRIRKNLPDRFLLYVGTLEPRKNLVRLLRALADFPAHERPTLVLIGARGWYDEAIFALIEQLGLRESVSFKGYVPDDELPLWYNAARAFVYPSLYEGFGMPVLESLACSTPVLTSATSALPEAAGGGALLVNPEDVEAIAEGLRRLLTDDDLREALRARGLVHAAQFSWARAAAETAALYRDVYARARR
ncbi:MAG: glycosyltransferase family 1 protein [Anaerolineae bacterium]|nr:glycosyltransferase family 1 protein [Anaerolineae bacterium]